MAVRSKTKKTADTRRRAGFFSAFASLFRIESTDDRPGVDGSIDRGLRTATEGSNRRVY